MPVWFGINYVFAAYSEYNIYTIDVLTKSCEQYGGGTVSFEIIVSRFIVNIYTVKDTILLRTVPLRQLSQSYSCQFWKLQKEYL